MVGDPAGRVTLDAATFGVHRLAQHAAALDARLGFGEADALNARGILLPEPIDLGQVDGRAVVAGDGIAFDPVDPGLDAVRGSETGQPRVGTQEDLLEEVVGGRLSHPPPACTLLSIRLDDPDMRYVRFSPPASPSR